MRSILFASALLVGQAVSAATITTYTFDAELTSYNAYQHGSAGTTDVPTAYSGVNAGYITFGRDGAGFGADGGCYVGIEDILTWGGSTPFYDSELSQHVGHGASYCDTFVRTFTPYWTFADGDITGDLFFTTTDFVIFEDFGSRSQIFRSPT